MYSHSGIQLILVAMKVSCHCCIIIVFNVTNVTLESIYDSNFSLSYIFVMVPIVFKTIYEVVTLTCAISKCIIGFVTTQVFGFSLIGKFFHNTCKYLVYNAL